MKTAIKKIKMMSISIGAALCCIIGVPSKILGTNSRGLTIFNEADSMNRYFNNDTLKKRGVDFNLKEVFVKTSELERIRSSYKGDSFDVFKCKILNVGKFRRNPFDTAIDFKSLNIETLDTLYSFILPNTTLKVGAPPENLSFGIGVQQSMVINALSSLIAEGFEEEMTATFVDIIYKDMKNDTVMKALYPNTFKLLQIREEGNINFNLGQLWKYAFENDFKSSLDNFIAFVDDTSNVKWSKTRRTDEYHVIKATSQMLKLIQEGKSPREVIKDTSISFKDTLSFVDRRIKLLNLLIMNFPLESVGPRIDIEKMQKDSEATKYFWGLLYQRNKVLFDNNVVREDSLPTINYSTVQLAGQFNKLCDIVDTLSKEQNNNSINYTKDYNLYLQCYIDLINIIFMKYNISTNGNPGVNKIKHLLNINQYTLKLRSAIVNNQYSDISFNEIVLLSNLSLGDSTLINNSTLRNILKYIPFMADVITAKDNNDVKAIIKSYALPRGSYRTKRKSTFCITINSYPGVTFGHEEYLKSGGNKYSEKWAWMTGFTAPIGIDFSFGNKKFLFFGQGKHSDEIMVTVLDLGAMVSYRLNDTLSETPPVTLDQVFSPGIYYVHGFSGYPISIGMGCAFSPKLRAIKINEATLKSNAWRINCFAGVDLPLFSIK